MENKYIILDLQSGECFTDENKNTKIFDTQEQANETCGMYEWENVWICQLIFNHIEK